jgi:hypothetical protein
MDQKEVLPLEGIEGNQAEEGDSFLYNETE